MKEKGGKQDETERTRGQTITYLIDLAKKAKESIINKDFENATHPLAEELKKFTYVFESGWQLRLETTAHGLHRTH